MRFLFVSGGRDSPFRVCMFGLLKQSPLSVTPAVWTEALAPYLADPARYPQCVLYHDDEFVCIYDKYPKAMHHLLLLPRTTGAIAAPVDLTVAHLPMLRQLERCATEIIAAMSASVPSTVVFRLGFHALPSLSHLHLHIISADLVHSVLCCAVLCCAVLCCAVLCCAVLCFIILIKAGRPFTMTQNYWRRRRSRLERRGMRWGDDSPCHITTFFCGKHFCSFVFVTRILNV